VRNFLAGDGFLLYNGGDDKVYSLEQGQYKGKIDFSPVRMDDSSYYEHSSNENDSNSRQDSSMNMDISNQSSDF